MTSTIHRQGSEGEKLEAPTLSEQNQSLCWLKALSLQGPHPNCRVGVLCPTTQEELGPRNPQDNKSTFSDDVSPSSQHFSQLVFKCTQDSRCRKLCL